MCDANVNMCKDIELNKVLELVCSRFDLDFEDVYNYVSLELACAKNARTKIKDDKPGKKRAISVAKLNSMRGCFYDPINEKLYQEIDMRDQE